MREFKILDIDQGVGPYHIVWCQPDKLLELWTPDLHPAAESGVVPQGTWFCASDSHFIVSRATMICDTQKMQMVNGNHRTKWLIEVGINPVPVAFPNSIHNSDMVKHISDPINQTMSTIQISSNHLNNRRERPAPLQGHELDAKISKLFPRTNKPT